MLRRNGFPEYFKIMSGEATKRRSSLPLWWGCLWLCLLTGGCACWPGVRADWGQVTVGYASTQPAGRPAPRTVVLTCRYDPGVNGSPASLDIVNAQAGEAASRPVNFGLCLYAVVWTPVLGTQHLAPTPTVVVFAKDCRPVVVECENDRSGCPCCGPPRPGPREFHVELRPFDRTSLSGNAREAEQILLLLEQPQRLSTALLLGQGVTPADRLMVYSSLLGHLNELSEQKGLPEQFKSRVSAARANLQTEPLPGAAPPD